MEYINHITFNSGDCIKNVPTMMEEVSDVLAKTVKDAQSKNLGIVLNGTALQLTMIKEYTYIATLYNNRKERIPILRTAGSIYSEDIKEIWNDYKKQEKQGICLPNIIMTKEGPKLADIPDVCPVSAPAVVDMLLNNSSFFPDIIYWTGSFTNALAWKILGDKIHQMSE